MLQKLHILNYAIIDEIEIDLQQIDKDSKKLRRRLASITARQKQTTKKG